MDRITKQLIVDLLTTQEKQESTISGDFEYFCNYSIVSNEYNRTFDADVITIGGGGDTGIDGIAIIVNGFMVEDQNEVDDLLESNGYLEVIYLFIQSKTSSNFDTALMHKFYFGVFDFFSENPQLERNENITKFVDLSDYILSKASHFRQNPTCKMFYVTTGVYKEDDPNLEAVRIHSITQLETYKLFNKLKSFIYGANELGKLYRKTKYPTSAEFVFANKVTLKDTEGINQSYYGVLPFREFKNIMIDSNGNMKSVYNDNVRDFQGENNPVNKSIAETLEGENPNFFSVLNNGITIVASKSRSSGNNILIEDYQIVNGCQTSNVLFENRNNEALDEMDIPIRLIVTEDEDIKSKITVSTNNQIAIKKEQLTAMYDFQKNLEQYYNSIEGDGRLYYERRSKQYNTDPSIIKRRIITIGNQIKSFSSMFLENPHLVTSYYGSIVKKIGDSTHSEIFGKDHEFAPYYLAGLTFYRLDSLFNSGVIDLKFKKVKFFVLMLVPKIISDSKLQHFNSRRKADEYCDPIIQILNNNRKTEELFNKAVDIIDKSNIDLDDKQLIKSKEMTQSILNQFNLLYP
jgi:AIPR protein